MTTHTPNTTVRRNGRNTACKWAVAATLAAVLPAAFAATAAGQLAPTTAPGQSQPMDPSANVGFTPAPQPSPLLGLIENGLDNSGKLAVTMNKTAVLTTRERTTRVSVSAPDIADVTLVGPTTILVTAKKPGVTQLIVWNEREQNQSVDVSVGVDILALREEFKKDFPDAAITVDVTAGQITLRGRVPNLKVAEQAGRVAGAYSKDVLNFLEVGGGQQIMLKVQFIEVSRAASLSLGFNSTFSDGKAVLGNINGPGADVNALGSLTGASGVTLFGAGQIGRTAFNIFVDALKTNNLARTLAEPTLVAASGEDASFLAGGEIPIPVPQAGAGGSSTISIEYKEFGVRLKYNAVVLGDGRIRMKIQPEVSDLDYNNTTSVGGLPVPGLRTRKASSVVEMNEGQTLALAGLLQRSVQSKNAATPLLGDLPIVGAFFRNVQYSRSETELVILVTPSLASAMNPDQVPAGPGDHFRYPNEAQLYGLGDLGNPNDPHSPAASRRVPAQRFIGPTGFGEAPEPVTSPVQPATGPADNSK